MMNISIALSLSAFVFSILQFFISGNRSKKESTLKAFEKLQNEVFDTKIFSSKNISSLIEKKDENDDLINLYNTTNWKELNNSMAKIEHFSAGVNTGIYSIFVLNRLAGDFIIERHNYLSSIIEHKRSVKPDKNHYVEFDKMIRRLIFIKKVIKVFGSN